MRRTAGIFFGVFCTVCSALACLADEARELVPEDTCIVELRLPAGATVTLDGKDYGTRRSIEYDAPEAGKIYKAQLTIRYPSGRTSEQVLLLQGGRRVELAKLDPAIKRPEVVEMAGLPDISNYCISPDMKYLCALHKNNTFSIWDVERKRLLRHFGEEVARDAILHRNRKEPMAFYGNVLYVNGYLYDVRTGKQIREIGGSEAASFSPDGKQLLTAGEAKWDSMERPSTAVLWDVESGRKLHTFDVGGLVTSVAFSPDGKEVLTGKLGERDTKLGEWRGPAEVVLWDVESGRKLRTFQVYDSGQVTSAAISPDGRRVLAGTFDHDGREAGEYKTGVAVLWDIESGRKLRTFEIGSGCVTAVAFSPDGRSVLTGIYSKVDGNVGKSNANQDIAILWDAESGQKTSTFKMFWWLFSRYVAFSPDGQRVFIGTSGGPAAIFDTKTGKEIWSFWLSTCFCPDGQFSMDGMRFARHNGIVYDLNTGRIPCNFKDSEKYDWYNTAISPDGRRIATAGCWSDSSHRRDPLAILWDTESREKIHTFEGRPSQLSDIAFSPDGRKLLIGTCQQSDNETKKTIPGEAILWDVESGEKIHTFEVDHGELSSVAFSPDSREVLIGTYGNWELIKNTITPGLAVLWDVESGRKIRTFNCGPSWRSEVSFSPDGRLVLCTSVLYDAKTGEKLREFQCARQDSFEQVSFDPSGRYIRVIGTWRMLHVFDWATGELVLCGSATDDGILYTTPEGCYDGPASASKEVCYRIGEELDVVPVDRFIQDFYRPGLYPSILKGERPLPDVQLGRSLPPTINIVSPKSGDMDAQRASIQVEATDQGGGVSNLAIYQNGARLLAAGETRQEGRVLCRTFQIALVEGENSVKITAASGDGSWEAEPAEIVLRYEKPLAKSRLYVVAVGISKYADANLNLNYAAKDAEAVAELFRRRGKNLYQEVVATLLVDEQATKEGIKSTLKEVASQSRPQDTLMLFLAGHGTMIGQRYYFVPCDLRKQSDRLEDDIRKQGLPADELSDYLGSAHALKRILILDTCASGGALGLAMKGRAGFELRGAVERLSRSQGIFTIAAAAASEQAQESKELGHGILSYALLAGLKAVDAGPLADKYVQPSGPERVVDVLEWFTYAAGQVPRLTEKLYGASQDVQTGAQGSSFPVLPLDE